MEKHFEYSKHLIDGNPDSLYLIMCSNINDHDTWVWMYAPSEHNFTPIWSNEYGSCHIKGSDLERHMKSAVDWINYNNERKTKQIFSLLNLHKVL